MRILRDDKDTGCYSVNADCGAPKQHRRYMEYFAGLAYCFINSG